MSHQSLVRDRLRGAETLQGSSAAAWFSGEEAPLARIGRWLFTLLICMHFCLAYLGGSNFLDVDQYVHGQASTPYQYRVLPMYVFRALMPNHLVQAIARHAPKPLANPYEIVLAGIVFLGILGSVAATRATIGRLTGDRTYAGWASLLVVYMAYFNLASRWGLNYTLPYDVPSLFFFSLGVYLVVSRRWWLFYLMFPIAVFNRETICFLTIFFLVWNWVALSPELSRAKRVARLLPHFVAQAAIWIGIKLYLAREFAGNTKETKIGLWLFSYNVHALLKPQQWPVLLSVCGFLLPLLWLGRRWIRVPALAWSCGIVMSLWLTGMMIVGVVPEIRIFSEWAAFTAPALALIIFHRLHPVASGSPPSA